MIDVSKLTYEEALQLANDLKKLDIITTNFAPHKVTAIYDALKKRGAKNPYVGDKIRHGIFDIVDEILDNYEKRGSKDMRCKMLPSDKDKREEYCRIVNGIVEVLYPYYNTIDGFRDKGVEIKEDAGVSKI